MTRAEFAQAEILADLLAAHDYALRLYLVLYDEHFREAAFPGYSPIVLTASEWTVTPGDPAVAETTAPQSWLQTDNGPGDRPELVRGYVLTRADTGAFRWTEPFTVPAGQPQPPFAMARKGDRLTFRPRIALTLGVMVAA